MREIYVANYSNYVGDCIVRHYTKVFNPPDIVPHLMLDLNPKRFDSIELTNIMLKYARLFDDRTGTISKIDFIRNFTFFNNSSSNTLIERIYDVLTRF